MAAIEKLKRLFTRQAETATRAAAPAGITINGPAEDSADTVIEDPAFGEALDDALGDAEGQSFIIDYVDAAGRESRRDITVWGFKPGAVSPLLVATCHLRGATRSFRLDRIMAIIDYDGVVHDSPPDFFVETFGMDPETAKAAGQASNPEQVAARRQNRIRQIIRAEANLLAALARSDGTMDPGEIDVMVEHCAQKCANRDLLFDDGDFPVIRNYLRRMRPGEATILKYLDQALSAGADDIGLFLRACIRLVGADGVIDEAERAMINDFAVEMTGVSIA